jgi:diguanylate cyclase (GGDEF)-like protein
MRLGTLRSRTKARLPAGWSGHVPTSVFVVLCLCVVVLVAFAMRDDTSPWLIVAGVLFIAFLLVLINRQHVRLSGLALGDPLTGLANHRAFHERLTTELARARRDGSSLALVSLDLDNFKQINDRHGHPYGDEVLESVGQKLRSAVRSGDVAARTGGEEFSLILPETDVEPALEIAERARAAVAEVAVRELKLSCSAGVACFPADAENASALCQRADGALYWAKRTGKHRTRQFDPKHVSVGDIPQRKAEIRRILTEPGAIAPVFQPVVALATGRIVGFEALTRFPTSQRAVEACFAEADSCGLAPELEAAAIRSALEPLGRPPGAHLALNVSPSALLTAEVEGVLPRDLTDLVIEITEHEEVARSEQLLDELRGLRERGARIAIDDTGAGYSGLKQLMDIRPDIVKLDRGLVAGIHHDPARMALVESFVRFAERIGATVCAEGVESLDDLAAVADLDVPWGQGFALSKPAPGWPGVAPVAAQVCRTSMEEALHATPDTGQVAISAGDRLLERLSAQLADARSTEDLEKALALIAAELHADKISLSRWVPEDGLVQTLAENGSVSEESFVLSHYPLTARVLLEREAVQVLVGDPSSNFEEIELMLSLGHRSMLMVPVVHRGESLGLVEAYSNEERAWTRAEINRARIISNQFASTIETFTLDQRPRD